VAFNEQTQPIEILSPSPRAAGLTTTSIDRNNYGRAQTFTWILSCGVFTGTSLTIVLQDSDDGSTGWNNIAASPGTNDVFTNTTTTAFKQATVKRTKRFLRAVITFTGTTATYALIAVAGDPLDSNI
jgi:hypothetical protein